MSKMENRLLRLETLLKEIQLLFSEKELHELAKKTGFIKRVRKVTALKFIVLCVFLQNNDGKNLTEKALSELCVKWCKECGVEITEEGLNQRFNDQAVAFLWAVLHRILEKRNRTPKLACPWGNLFSRFRIMDSTGITLPEKCATDFRGTGGRGSEAGLKVQFEYDLFNGDLLHLSLHSACENDSVPGTESLRTCQKKDVFVRDLGYYSLKNFDEIGKNGAFFLSRAKTNIALYKKTTIITKKKKKKKIKFCKMDMVSLIQSMEEGEIREFVAYAGQKEKLPTRVVITKLTEEHMKSRQSLWEERVRLGKLVPNTLNAHMTLVNVFITNIPRSMVSKEELYSLYALRWQIEKLFHTFKSSFQIDKYKAVKCPRFLCHLLGKFIEMSLSMKIFFSIREAVWIDRRQELSEEKGLIHIRYFLSIFLECSCDLNEQLHQLIRVVFKHARKHKRRGKPTPFELLHA